MVPKIYRDLSALDNLVDWRGPNYVGLCMTMAYDLYMSPDSDFFEPLFWGLIYCFSDIFLKLMLEHT